MPRIKLRRGTMSELATEDPVLLAGEVCLDTTRGVMRVGDGETHWVDLPDYAGPGVSDPTAVAIAIAVEAAAPSTNNRLATLADVRPATVDLGEGTALVIPAATGSYRAAITADAATLTLTPPASGSVEITALVRSRTVGQAALSIDTEDAYFGVSLDADTYARTAYLLIGGADVEGELTLALSDDSAADVVIPLTCVGTEWRRVAVSYRAGAAAQTLDITWAQTSATGALYWQSVAVEGPAPDAGSALLTAALQAAPSRVDLTATGRTDWALWGRTDASTIDRKAGVTAQIGTLGVTGDTAARVASAGSTWDFEDAEPAVSQGFTLAGITPFWGCGGTPVDLIPAGGHVRLWAEVFANGTASVDAGVYAPAGAADAPAALRFILITPAQAQVVAGGTQQFTATGFDQYGEPIALAGGTWSVVGTGSISAAGLYTAASAGTDSIRYSEGAITAYALVTVSARGAAGLLRLTESTPGASEEIVLTAEGEDDWIHWGIAAASDVNRKDGGSLIGDLTPTSTGWTTSRWYGADPDPSWSWTDGDPTASEAGTYAYVDYGWADRGIGRGWTLSVPASESVDRTLKLWLRAYQETGVLTAELSDDSDTPIVWQLASPSGLAWRRVTIPYRAGATGQTLELRWTSQGATGNIGIAAAALTEGTPAPLEVTSIDVTPASATISEGGEQRYVAEPQDQYGRAMVGEEVDTWAVSGSGASIAEDGVNAAIVTALAGGAGGPYTVTASLGAVDGTAAVTVTGSLPSEAQAEVDWLETNVAGFAVQTLTAEAGTTAYATTDALTIEDLRGLTIDATPPEMSGTSETYAAHMRDDLGANAPYIADGIPAFRLAYFTAEFNYTGWYNYQMFEYASLHGFESIAPYVLTALEKDPFPDDANWLKWGYFIDWKTWCANRGITWGRWDLFYDADPRTQVLASNPAWAVEANTNAMLDIEQASVLAPDTLRAQSWYPSTGTAAQKTAFEAKYYIGFSLHHSVMAEAATAKGWPSVGVYPQLFSRGWYEMLNAPTVETKVPSADYRWAQMGQYAVPKQNVLYPDNYLYYWDPRNVGYVLAHQDYLRACVATLPEADQRPIRPYLWPLLHGGDADYHWWREQPLPTEDMRAIYFYTLMCGCDGVVLWNWSGTCNHHLHRPVLTQAQYDASHCSDYGPRGLNSDLQVAVEYSKVPTQGGDATTIKRYDVLHVTAFDGTNVTYKHMPAGAGYGTTRSWGDLTLTYTQTLASLSPNLRQSSQAIAGAVEGLALVKVMEYILRYGTPQPDPTAVNRWTQRKPLIRMTRLENLWVVATYDPNVPYDTQPVGETTPPVGARVIELTNFGGVTGRTVQFDADDQLRIYFVQDVAA